MLAREIACLASIGGFGVTSGRLAAAVWVEVSASGSAIAILWNGLLMNVVQEWATLGRQAGDGNLDGDTLASSAAGNLDGTRDVVGSLRLEDNFVLGANGVVFYNRSILCDDGRGDGEQRQDGLSAHGSDWTMDQVLVWWWQWRDASECGAS